MSQRTRAGGAHVTYEVGIVDFFNARHAVKASPPHTHSWRVEIKVRRPRYLGEQSLIDVEATRKTIRRLFAHYEERLLNDIPPFTFQEPTVENLVAYFFQQIEKEFRGTNIKLHSLTIWESPTNYVTLIAES